MDNTGGFAGLADHGDLVAYPSGGVVRREGAYTWYRTDISQAHALHAIASGDLRVTTPAGVILDFRYDRHIEHPSGDWTWVGHLPGHPGERAILTFGDRAAYGTIAQPGGRPLRLTTRDGAGWLVATDAGKLAEIGSSATRRPGRDYRIVPASALRHAPGSARRGAGTAAASSPMLATAATTTTVDVLVGYTPGFASARGGASAALTRLNNLVDTTNIAYGDSQIDARIRMVRAMQVDYTDSNSNDTALQEMSGYDSDAQKPVPPDPAFDALRHARETYGADLVVLVRDFRTPENGGCGIAWLLGGGLGGTDAIMDSADFGYSVVSDGTDVDESDGKNYFCQNETFAHELGHNMGAAHDKATSEGDDGVLDNPDDYGAFTYSFGYKTPDPTGGFYTIMAYGESYQRIYDAFSSPDNTFCGGMACGAADTDNTRTLKQTIPVVAGFRVPGTAPRNVLSDFDGDGQSDVFWRNGASGANVVWPSADRARRQPLPSVPTNGWQVVGIGDFDGDGESDVFWRNGSTGANVVWPSADRARRQPLPGQSTDGWRVVGTGDFDGDGQSDVFWRNVSSGANMLWPSADASRSRTLPSLSAMGWAVVGTGDFDGDGQSDVFWRNASTGANMLWLSADASRSRTLPDVSTSGWNVVGTGDFDGDGESDVFWRNVSTGSNVVWPSADRDRRKPLVRVSTTGWDVVATGDFDGDGESDVFWRNASNGSNVVWPSADRGRRQPLPHVSTSWRVVP